MTTPARRRSVPHVQGHLRRPSRAIVRGLGVGTALLATLAMASGQTGGAMGAPAPPPQLTSQLIPRDTSLTVAIELQTTGYPEMLNLPGPGQLTLAWYVGRPASDANAKTLVASAVARVFSSGHTLATLEPTTAGRRLGAHSRSLSLRAVAHFTPSGSATPVVTTQTFTL